MKTNCKMKQVIRQYFKLFTFLILNLSLSMSLARAEDIPLQTQIECAGTHSEIISTCTQDRTPSCSKQEWVFKDHIVDLKKEEPSDFNVIDWACLPSKQGTKIVFWSVNWGNCDSCERLTIWEPTGKKLVNWKDFDQTYKDWDFPRLIGDQFGKQFTHVKLQ